LHHGFNIRIESVEIDFTMDIEKVAELLTDISKDWKQLSGGGYISKIQTKNRKCEAICGEGNALSYFYCNKDIAEGKPKVGRENSIVKSLD
jgi:hypothetical protein